MAGKQNRVFYRYQIVTEVPPFSEFLLVSVCANFDCFNFMLSVSVCWVFERICVALNWLKIGKLTGKHRVLCGINC